MPRDSTRATDDDLMLLMLLIGWTILLPAIVVAGLYLGSSVLSRRRAALEAPYGDLLTDDVRAEDDAAVSAPLVAATAPSRATASRAPQPGPVDPAPSERPSVAARY